MNGFKGSQVVGGIDCSALDAWFPPALIYRTCWRSMKHWTRTLQSAGPECKTCVLKEETSWARWVTSRNLGQAFIFKRGWPKYRITSSAEIIRKTLIISSWLPCCFSQQITIQLPFSGNSFFKFFQVYLSGFLKSCVGTLTLFVYRTWQKHIIHKKLITCFGYRYCKNVKRFLSKPLGRRTTLKALCNLRMTVLFNCFFLQTLVNLSVV